MNPAHRKQRVEAHRHGLSIEHRLRDIQASVRGLRRHAASHGPEDVAALDRIEGSAERAERACLALQGFGAGVPRRDALAAAVRRLSSPQERKTPAATGATSKATRAGDAHEHSE